MRRGKANLEFWLLLGLTLMSVIVRFWRLGEPGEIVFDETYYAKWGEDYFQGQKFFDVHPPLGKLLIGIGSYLMSSSPEATLNAFGWRFAVALFGIFIVPLTYLIARKLFTPNRKENQDSKFQPQNSARIAALAGLFVLIDGLILVQTRTALLDSFLLTFSLAAYLSFLHYRDATSGREANFRLLATGVFLGLALATKWTAVAPFLVIFTWWWSLHTKIPPTTFLTKIASFGLIPFGIYAASFLTNVRETDFWRYLWDWHKQSWNFHEGLRASHPYESRWPAWLYLARPVWYYFKDENGLVRGVIALGNPLLWWATIPAIVASVWYAVRRHYLPLSIALLAFIATYAPWIMIGRTQFQYYLVGGVPFLMMMLAWWLDRLLETPFKKLAWILIGAAVLTFLFFLPLYTAYPIPNWYYKLHIWLKSWI